MNGIVIIGLIIIAASLIAMGFLPIALKNSTVKEESVSNYCLIVTCVDMVGSAVALLGNAMF